MQPRTATLNRVSLCFCTFTLTDGESGESVLLISQHPLWMLEPFTSLMHPLHSLGELAIDCHVLRRFAHVTFLSGPLACFALATWVWALAPFSNGLARFAATFDSLNFALLAFRPHKCGPLRVQFLETLGPPRVFRIELRVSICLRSGSLLCQ